MHATEPAQASLAPQETGDGAHASSEQAADPAETTQRSLVVVFASQKGGTGKTTLCGQLSVQATHAEAGPVALIDTDPQGSLSDWWNVRRAEMPLFVKAEVRRLAQDIEALERQGVRRIFVDTPPTITDDVRQVVRHADLVVVPTRPGPHDLRALGPTLDMIEDYGIPLVFVVNGAFLRAKITSAVCVALSQHGTVAPTLVHQRTDFATSMIDGRTVMEVKPDSPASAEIAAVWQYLEERLTRLQRRSQRPAKSSVARQVFVANPLDHQGFGRRGFDSDSAPARV